ncbi:MAG TPA: radical SAM protein [Candidatus Omnitrophota bacterium]|nr:radical SAM protein [Candidatus Omnitrophota bacterium]
MDVKEVHIQRILNPTSIDLGEYVINPYLGCAYGCLYCYVRSNRVVSRKAMEWGSFVEVRVNACQRLEKELLLRRPATVLLGSTTECFQPLEEQYHLTQRILEILNRNGVGYVILTRSPAILNSLALLKQGCCRRVYFTVNDYPREFKNKLEPFSPSFEERQQAVNALLDEGVPVIPYFSPVLPGISEYRDVFRLFLRAESVEFECLNFNLGNIDDIMQAIGEVDPGLAQEYAVMRANKPDYSRAWQAIQQDIADRASAARKRFAIHVHQFGGYFQNSYASGSTRH